LDCYCFNGNTFSRNDIKLKTYKRSYEFFDLDHLIEIWGKRGCHYCNMAQSLSKQEGLEYIYYQLDDDYAREQLLEKFPDAKTFPQIVVDGNHIGGYMEYRTFLKGPPQHD